jgi:CDP-diacylglycerol--glycerol-3-phosphate 3-phosphatidyltransferase/CDP-diacylglycerol--inositol 3-phosphatidyltransferase
VTLVGTIGVSAGALYFFPRGELFAGCLFITAFVFSDLIDGYMARASGTSSRWGAFLDSTLDRIADAAIFGGFVLYFADVERDMVMASVALYCLVMGSVTSYARARAESLGMQARWASPSEPTGWCPYSSWLGSATCSGCRWRWTSCFGR